MVRDAEVVSHNHEATRHCGSCSRPWDPFRAPGTAGAGPYPQSQARELEALQAAGSLRVGDNEQIEFLGDAVLGFLAAKNCCTAFPNFREGELSKLRAHLVSEKHLIRVAQELELGALSAPGTGRGKSGGRNKTALLVDALEAVLAALFLDGGLDAARRIVLQSIVDPELGALLKRPADCR